MTFFVKTHNLFALPHKEKEQTWLMNILVKSSTFLLLTFSALTAEEEGFVSIFNGKNLDGWTAARSTGEGNNGAFSVNVEEKAIHVYAGKEAGSKQTTDCLNTVTQYSHYILKLEYKWLDKRFAPRTDWDRDAGLLFHVHGDLKKVWPFCLEMQIGETPKDSTEQRRFHTGDLFVLGPVRTKTPKTGGYYDSNATPVMGKHVQTILGDEKPKGEWNEMEIRVLGSKQATFILNGEVVLETFDFEQQQGEGKFAPLSKGSIGLQAEWAELLYRNIRIKELPSTPSE